VAPERDDGIFDSTLEDADPEVGAALLGELGRQRRTLDLVASESVAPRAVLEAQGSVLTAKYADGYPGERDYDTCEWIDEIEFLAIERAKVLFGAEHANVQPYSGASSNAAVLHALCEPGDAVLGFDFNHGGHPTQYSASTSAGRNYSTSAYHVREDTRLVDMDEVLALARRHRPRVVFAGWSCYSRHLDFAAFREIADEVGAALVVDMAHFAGPRGRWDAPRPGPLRGRLHHDDPQDPRRRPRGSHLVPGRACRQGRCRRLPR
jgi:glycine hydroxymethyltransferase